MTWQISKCHPVPHKYYLSISKVIPLGRWKLEDQELMDNLSYVVEFQVGLCDIVRPHKRKTKTKKKTNNTLERDGRQLSGWCACPCGTKFAS